MKSTGMESTGIPERLKLLRINTGDGVRIKCSSNVQITRPNQPRDHPIPVYEIDLKNCSNPTDFYFYDVTNQLGRINNGYTRITGYGHMKLLRIITDFRALKPIDMRFRFFNSRGKFHAFRVRIFEDCNVLFMNL